MKVLIVVDMQKDFIDGALGTPEAQAIVPKVAETIEQMAAPDTVVIFTKDTHGKDYMNTLEGKNLPIPHCIKGTIGHSIDDKVFNAYINVIGKYANAYISNPMRLMLVKYVPHCMGQLTKPLTLIPKIIRQFAPMLRLVFA